MNTPTHPAETEPVSVARPEAIADAPGGLPLLGHLAPLLRDSLGFLGTLPSHGDLVAVRVGPLRTFIVCAPELVRALLRDDHVFDKGGRFFELARELSGDNLATCEHARHRRQRRLVQQAFARDRFDGYGGVMSAHSTAVARSWRDGQILDVVPEMQKITLGTLMGTMFSGALSPSAMDEAMDDLAAIFGGSYLRASVPSWLAWLPGFGKHTLVRAAERLRGNLAAVVLQRRAEGTDRGDLLSALLSARDSAGGRGSVAPGSVAPGADECGRTGDELTESEVVDQAIAFFGAGTDTTASALAWTLYLLARHPAVQRRVQAEADQVLDGRTAAAADLPDLRLTGRVVTEALRLYPPAWVLTRTVAADTRLGGHRLPAGATIVCSPYLLHRCADLYDDPERFDPDRWDAADRPQPPRYAFLPFGAGARKCIGDQFAFKEAVLAVANISARWHVELPSGHRPKAYAGITLRPQGLRLRVRSRRPPAAGPQTGNTEGQHQKKGR